MVAGPVTLGGLPRPLCGHLTIYGFGAGVGEATLISLPDGHWVLVDCCRQAGHCLPLLALRDLGVAVLDLFVLTHPDLDHVDGLMDLAAQIDIRHAWRYPQGTKRDLLAGWCQRVPGNKRLAELNAALRVLDDLQAQNRCEAVGLSATWRPYRLGSCEITPLAPSMADGQRAQRQVERIVQLSHGRPILSREIEDFLLGRNRKANIHGNMISVALSIRWNDIRVLLAGDVERGSGPYFGWRGIREVLTRNGHTDEIRDLTVIGVAHHGSHGAFDTTIWAEHARSRKVPIALIAPYARTKNSPPHQGVLRELRRHVDQIAVTAPPHTHGWNRMLNAGWTLSGTAMGQGHFIAISVAPDGSATATSGSGGSLFK